MKAIFPSTLALHETQRQSVSRVQRNLERAEIEVSTGRHADVGLALGAGTALTIEMRQITAELDAITQSNNVVRMRLDQTQAALGALKELGEGFMSNLMTARMDGADRSILVDDARSRLAAMIDIMSTTSAGVAIFSGTRIDAAALENYLATPPGAGRTAVQGAFVAAFGFAADDPQVSTLTAAQVTTYLDGAFAALFDDPSWNANFSSASSNVLQDRISPGETVDTSVSANAPGFRDLMRALVAVIDGGTEQLNADAFAALTDRLTETAGNATLSLTRLQSEVGITEERLAKASDRIDVERGIVERRFKGLESVDSYEAANRLTLLTTQLETSYAVTARLQRLSLLDYL